MERAYLGYKYNYLRKLQPVRLARVIQIGYSSTCLAMGYANVRAGTQKRRGAPPRQSPRGACLLHVELSVYKVLRPRRTVHSSSPR